MKKLALCSIALFIIGCGNSIDKEGNQKVCGPPDKYNKSRVQECKMKNGKRCCKYSFARDGCWYTLCSKNCLDPWKETRKKCPSHEEVEEHGPISYGF